MPARKIQKYQATTMYDVVFSAVAQVGPVKLRPCNSYSVKGRVLNDLDPAVIASATPQSATTRSGN